MLKGYKTKGIGQLPIDIKIYERLNEQEGVNGNEKEATCSNNSDNRQE